MLKVSCDLCMITIFGDLIWAWFFFISGFSWSIRQRHNFTASCNMLLSTRDWLLLRRVSNEIMLLTNNLIIFNSIKVFICQLVKLRSWCGKLVVPYRHVAARASALRNCRLPKTLRYRDFCSQSLSSSIPALTKRFNSI